jgi:hypothetical protein
MRPGLTGANHEGFESFLSGAVCGNAKFFFDKVLCPDDKGECLRQKEKQQKP